MQAAGIGDCTSRSLVTNATYKAVTLDNHVDIVRDKQFHSTEECVDIYLLVLIDGSISQVQTQTAAEGIQSGTMERLTLIDVLIGTETCCTIDAFAILTLRNGALEPL